ncbi:unnamed protein product [Symbiodinium microadriaticum]|nr:unnamed protein product [Symbiodinium microadriaticum]
MAAFVDASSACSAADFVFQTSSLRPFLNHPGIEKAGTAFHKPMNPEHAVQEKQINAGLSLRPFVGPKDSAPLRRPDKASERSGRRPRGLMANNFARTMPPRHFRISDASPSVQMYIGQQSLGATHSKEQNRTVPSEDELTSFQFFEEPDDPRVAVPAHRIGDEPQGRLRPYVSDRSAKKKISMDPSESALCLTAKPKPLHTTTTAPSPSKGHGSAKPVLANAGLLQFMLPSFGFPATIAEEATLEQLLFSPSHHDERFQARGRPLGRPRQRLMQGRQRSDRRAQPHAARPEVNEAAPLPHERAVPGAQPSPVSAVSAVPQAAPVPTPVPHQQSSVGSENMLDVDVTVLAFAQWVMELKNKSSNSQKSLQIELNTIKNAINGNHSDLADFKRHGAAIQQQMQSEINEIRESLSSVFMEITAAVRNNAAADQDLKMKIQMLNEQAVRNETAFAQLADAADQSQSKLRAAAQEMQQFSERMRDDLASLNQKTDTLQGTVLDRADQLKSETDQLSQDLRTQLEKRKVQLQKMVQDVVNIGESLQGLVNDFGGVKQESGATQTKLNSSLYSLDARRQQGTTAPAACQVMSSKFQAMPMAQERVFCRPKDSANAAAGRSGTVGFPGGSKCFMSAFDFDVADHPRNGLARALSLSVAEGASRPLWPSEMLPNQAEWTEQSAAGRHDFDEELEALWAEAGAADGATNSSPGTSCDAATVASRALATANAARKGVFGVICGTGTADVSTAARRGMIQSGGRLQAAELSFCKEGASAATAIDRGGSDPQDDSEEETSETSEEEVEMQEVSMPSQAANSKPKVAADVVELDIDINGPEDPHQRTPTTARCAGKLSKVSDAASGATNSPMRGRIMVGTDLETKVRRKQCEESHDASGKTGVHAVETANVSTCGSNKDIDGQAELDMKISSAEPSGQEAADAEIEKEWEEIAFRSDELAKEARESRGKAVAQQDALRKPICYKEVQSWLHDLSTSTEVATTEKPERRPEEFVLRLKTMPFDFNDILHYRLLHTMYSKLARCKVCPRIGSHWEVLGFQGTDPHTDLNRSGGLLNVLHMFFCFSHFFEIFKAAYLLSQDDQQHFPLAAVCINITKMVTDELAAGSFSNILDEIGKEAIPIAETTCLIFSGGLHHFYSRWRTQKRTIRDSEQTFKEVRALMCSEPATLLEELDKGSEQATIGAIKANSAQVEFTNLDLVDAKEALLESPDPRRLRHYQAAE